jgi:hypothetical protein
MIRLFDDRGLVLRNWFSIAILVAAVIWGVIEIVRSEMGAADQTGLLFGLGFFAAAAYGLYRMLGDGRDTITRFEADFESGQSAATLWRPWGLRRLEAPLTRVTGWRMYVAVRRRNQPTFLLLVDHPGNPRPLQIDLAPNRKALDGLRQLAPEAIAEFEERTGRRKAD